RAGILAALDDMARQVDSRSTALIFFAGHGIRGAEGFSLLPHNYDPDDLTGSAIGAAEFHEKVAALRERAQKLIVLLNCCHAGGVGVAVLGAAGAAPGGDAPHPYF